jgi:hypothetical protein
VSENRDCFFKEKLMIFRQKKRNSNLPLEWVSENRHLFVKEKRMIFRQKKRNSNLPLE